MIDNKKWLHSYKMKKLNQVSQPLDSRAELHSKLTHLYEMEAQMRPDQKLRGVLPFHPRMKEMPRKNYFRV